MAQVCKAKGREAVPNHRHTPFSHLPKKDVLRSQLGQPQNPYMLLIQQALLSGRRPLSVRQTPALSSLTFRHSNPKPDQTLIQIVVDNEIAATPRSRKRVITR